MKIAIIGYGIEGQSCHKYFSSRGESVTICDKSTEIDIPVGTDSQLGNNYLSNLDRFDLIIRSAGINRSIILGQNPNIGAKISTVINQFMQHAPTRNIIGVTGTKGKGTTSTLISRIIKASGKNVWLGGNIGNSPLDFIDEVKKDDWVVLELSSFQLSDIQYSPHIAVCLMVVPEHLDWHEDLGDYTHSKSNLFKYQEEDDVAIYYVDNATSSQIAHSSRGRLIPYMASPGAIVKENGDIEIDSQFICNVSDLKLLGKHNWQNVCAAITAVWQAGIHDANTINSVVTSFSGLPHRLEFIRELDGVKYYNDSFGTTPETAIVAIKSFKQPKILILGGSSKGSDYSKLVETVITSNVRSVVTIGETGHLIQRLLGLKSYTKVVSDVKNMEEIVNAAKAHSKSGDIVLLSPASASFGLFKDYKDRGDQFNEAVQSLR